MKTRVMIVSLAWGILFALTYFNITKALLGPLDTVLWFVYLAILSAIILWPSSKKGQRVEAGGESWSNGLRGD